MDSIGANIDIKLITKLFLCKTQLSIIFDYLSENVEQLSSVEVQEKLLESTMNHFVMRRYPLSISYRQLFMKGLIRLLESNELSVCDSIPIIYTQLISNSEVNKSDNHFNYLSYVLSNGEVISLEESNYMVTNGTTGLMSWTAAKHLAHFIVNNKELVENKSVLELGSGIGLTGIVVLKTCRPNWYAFSDHHSDVLRVLRNNISNNKVNQKSNVYSIDWKDEHCLDCYLNDNNPDVIIAADVVFDPLITNYLCLVLNKLFNNCNKSLVCYIGCTLRNGQTIQHFRQLIVEKYNLKIDNICTSDNNKDLSSFYYDSLNTKSSIYKISVL